MKKAVLSFSSCCNAEEKNPADILHYITVLQISSSRGRCFTQLQLLHSLTVSDCQKTDAAKPEQHLCHLSEESFAIMM